MNRRGDRRSALATATQVFIIAILAIAVVTQVGRLSHNAVVPDTPTEVPEEVAVVEMEPERAVPYVTIDDVNLRSGPGTAHAVMQVLPVQTDIVVTGQARQGYSPVRVDGTSAWVSTTYIAPAADVLASTLSVSAAPAVVPPVVPSRPVSEPTVAPTEPAVESVAEPEVMTVSDTLVVEEPVAAPAGERWVEVDRSTATVTLHHGNTVIAAFQGLIGKDPSADGYYSTALGRFHVFSMEKALTETPFAPGVYLTDFVGFDPERSNGFHSPTRDEFGNVMHTGGTTTLGCVRLDEDEAKQMFDFAFIGMRVEVHD